MWKHLVGNTVAQLVDLVQLPHSDKYSYHSIKLFVISAISTSHTRPSQLKLFLP